MSLQSDCQMIHKCLVGFKILYMLRVKLMKIDINCLY